MIGFDNLTKDDVEGYSYITESFAHMLNNLPDNQKPMVKELIKQQVAEYKEAIEIYDNASVAHSWHNAMDVSVSEMIKSVEKTNRKISCKKGCGFCCFQKVDITKDEAILLNAHIEEERLVLDEKALEKQRGCNNYEDYNKLDVKYRKCVFLDKNMSCSVYKYRPGSCRTLVTVSDPDLCDTEKNPNHRVEKINTILPESYLIASHMAAEESGDMANMLNKYKLKKDE